MRSAFAVLIFSSLFAQAQTGAILTGRVKDTQDAKPVPFANVYINNSTRGTIADAEGRYQLTNIPSGLIEIVASAVGYSVTRQTINIENKTRLILNFSLSSNNNSLTAVTVTAKRSKVYERHLRTFKRELLGDTPFTDRCLILNAGQVLLTEEGGHLQAKIAEPLIIENNALGYRIFYTLQYFDTYRLATHYAGTTRFEEMTPTDAQQAERWRRNRQKAYLGSIRHLLASLVAGTSQKEGFLVYEAAFEALPDPSVPVVQLADQQPTQVINPDTLLRPGSTPAERQLVSARPVEVFYVKQSVIRSPYRNLPYAYSLLFLPKGKATITTKGWMERPMGLEVRGAMSDNRLANLLPADWKPTDDNPMPVPVHAGVVVAPDSRLDSLANVVVSQQRAQPPSVFLHVAKALYMTGDTLWLSGYVLDPITHRLWPSTKDERGASLQVELRMPDDRLVQHQWLRLANGRTTGFFRLSDSLTTGYYRLRAYTEADTANGQPAFERTVSVISAISSYAALSASGQILRTDSMGVDIQFLPEGGQWVAGLPARLGVKAVDRHGKGVMVAGQIRSDQGEEVGLFRTNHLGITHVVFTPLTGRRYVANWLTSKNEHTILLPPVQDKGLILSVDNVTDSSIVVVQVLASASYGSSNVYLLVRNHGQVLRQFKLELREGKASLSLPVAGLAAGLVCITLFDGLGVPQAERLAFVPERFAPVKVELTTDKPKYVARESMTIALRVVDGFGDPLAIYGSAAVTDAGQQSADSLAATVQTHLLMTGMLRGPVEDVGYYFRSRDVATRQALDDLLLTQGWRRLLNKPVASAVLAPSSGVTLRGRAVDLKNRPLGGVSLLLTFNRQSVGSFARSVRTNLNGTFRLDDLLLTDTTSVRFRVMNASFKPIQARVLLDLPGIQFPAGPAQQLSNDEVSESYLLAMRRRQSVAPGSYRDPMARQLSEVIIRAAKPDDDSEARRVSLHGAADATVLFDENSRSYTNVYEMMVGRVPGVLVQRKAFQEKGPAPDGYKVTVRGESTLSSNSSPLYIVDGMYITENEEGNALYMFNPGDIERIEVLKNGGGAIYGARGGAGAIAFFLKKWNRSQPNKQTETVATIDGYAVQREFYIPRYTAEATTKSDTRDERDIICWKPQLISDSRGQTTLKFTLSDTVRVLRLTVQGVTTDGMPVFIERVVSVR